METSRLKRTLSGLIDVRREELSRVLPMTTAYGMVMASLYVLKPVRNALFLDRLGIDHLPYVLMLVAVVGGLAAGVFIRFGRTIRLRRLVLCTFLFLMVNLLAFWLILPYGWSWSIYLFYVWVKIYGLMATSLLSLLCNAVFNPREARRLFGLIGTGGIAGAILGGAFTGWIVKIVGTEDLLIVCIAAIGSCLGLLYGVRPEEGRMRREKERPEGALRSIAKSDLLRHLAMSAGLVAVVATIVEVQFNEIVDRVYPLKDDKTAFFGRFFAYLSAFAFCFQLLFTTRILRSLGVGVALFFLPLSLGIGSLAILIIPGLWAGITIKIGDGGFRHSIHKAATEILFLPIPPQVKQRTKILIDTTVDNLATGVGAVLVLLLIGFFGMAYHHLSLISLTLIGIWSILIFRTRRAYVEAFRKALERHEIDLGELRSDISEASSIKSLVTSLESGNERQMVYALDMLSSIKDSGLVGPVLSLLAHDSAEVRRKAIQTLQRQDPQDLNLELEGLLQDDDPDVRREAMHLFFQQAGGDRPNWLKKYLKDPDPRIQGAAVECVATYGAQEEKDLIDEAFIQTLVDREGEEGETSRIQAAKVLGALNRPELNPYLLDLIKDPSPPVAMQTIDSVGRIGDLEFVPLLISKLSDKRYRADARKALAAFGPKVLDLLEDYLSGPALDLITRSNILRVLNEIPTQQSVDILMARIDQEDVRLKHPLIKSLNKLRRYTELSFNEKAVDGALIEEVKTYGEIQRSLQVLREDPIGNGGAERLLHKALSEKLDQKLEFIFRLLGLHYPAKDIYNAYLGIVSGSRSVRASAIEFLDNVVQKNLKDIIFPYIDQVPGESAIFQRQGVLGRRIENRVDALIYLIRGGDSWLKACAIYNVGAVESHELVNLVEEAVHDPDPVIRQTAEMVIRK